MAERSSGARGPEDMGHWWGGATSAIVLFCAELGSELGSTLQTLRSAGVRCVGLLGSLLALRVPLTPLASPPGRTVRQNHKDYTQVQLDVNRSTHRFPQGMRAEQRRVLQEQLIDLILHILRAHPELHYYQGYHDIAVTLLLVAGERMGSALLEKLSTHHLRDFMDPTMDSTKHILNYLMPILQQESLRLHDFMLRYQSRSWVGTIFALSWLITWYGHVLTSFPHILRLYDFFLASHPLMPVYFAAVIVLHREAEVLACDCDMPSVHQLLSQIPQNLPYERLISWALQLFQRHPHAELAKQAAGTARAEGSFSAFQLATTQQRPDAVLRRQRQQDSAHAETAALLPTAGHSPLVKAAVWGISATLGAVALAVTQTALEWAPEFLLQLF
uniref:Rab-GAP TBC domain-containing protein n=1 Tax=Gopherus agassizii TaxID=38772 RepID=A0A452IAG2_9SAUR